MSDIFENIVESSNASYTGNYFRRTAGSEQTKDNGREQEEYARRLRYKSSRFLNENVKNDPAYFYTCLDTMAKFNRLSVRNNLLIAETAPEATELHSLEEWNRKGTRIKRGEKPVFVIAKNERYSDGSDTEPEFVTKALFDVSQTTAVQGEPNRAFHSPEDCVKAVMYNPPCTITLVGDDGIVDRETSVLFKPGDTPRQNGIYIRRDPDASMEKRFEAFAREKANELCYRHNKKIESIESRGETPREKKFTDGQTEVISHSVAYMLCRRNRIQTRQKYEKDMPDAVSKAETGDLLFTLGKIRDYANDISLDMEKYHEAAAKIRSEHEKE